VDAIGQIEAKNGADRAAEKTTQPAQA
jgi:hypothetical protein